MIFDFSFQQCPPKVKQLDMATTFCSSSRCLHDDKHLTSNSERIEVCTVLPLKSKLQSFQSQLCVRWNAKGEATFHKDCWQALLKSARARMKKSTTIDLLAAEKEMIKLAAKTAETHDSFEFIASEAKRISQTIKQAEHFVVFTGAGISTSAGIGDFRYVNLILIYIMHQATNISNLLICYFCIINSKSDLCLNAVVKNNFCC